MSGCQVCFYPVGVAQPLLLSSARQSGWGIGGSSLWGEEVRMNTASSDLHLTISNTSRTIFFNSGNTYFNFVVLYMHAIRFRDMLLPDSTYMYIIP